MGTGIQAWTLRWMLVVAFVVGPAAAAAQVGPPAAPPSSVPGQGPPSPPSPPVPSTPAHPAQPWGLGIAIPYGQLMRYVYMPPQAVTLEYLVPVAPETPPPAEEPPRADGEARGEDERPQAPGPQIVRQQVTVPGYYVRETTAGFHYPERWVIEQLGVGAYRWRLLPAQFIPKR